jgi:hypothetical protein
VAFCGGIDLGSSPLIGNISWRAAAKFAML